jgi:hypothetical protein
MAPPSPIAVSLSFRGPSAAGRGGGGEASRGEEGGTAPLTHPPWRKDEVKEEKVKDSWKRTKYWTARNATPPAIVMTRRRGKEHAMGAGMMRVCPRFYLAAIGNSFFVAP